MNKRELIKIVSKKTKLPEKQVKQIIDLFLNTITDSVRKGDNVIIQRFGTFRAVVLKEKIARNPQTGEKIKVPTYRTLRFKPCLELKILQ